MTGAVDELKVRARRALKARRAAGDPAVRLKDCLHDAARQAGFVRWDHALRVLGGAALTGDDMGAFWHAPRCDSLLNPWFAQLADARGALAVHAGAVLLPYRRQFVVASPAYLDALGLDPAAPHWADAGHDLVAAYGGPAWAAAVAARLDASGRRR